jgi:hypothetical protein
LLKEGGDLLLHIEACRNAPERRAPSTVFVAPRASLRISQRGLTWP